MIWFYTDLIIFIIFMGILVMMVAITCTSGGNSSVYENEKIY